MIEVGRWPVFAGPAEGGIGAGGLAEGGGFAASEGGKALLPVRRGRPVPLELTSAVRIEWVEPGGGDARPRCARAEDQP